MKKYSILIFMIFIIMMSICGCKPNTCYTSNDDCVEKPTASCILNDGTTYKNCGTCECIFVDPLVITVGTLTDAKVGEEYKGKEDDITATGGIQPYSWSLLIDPADSDKLDWLTIDPTTGVLSNKPGKAPDAPFPDGIKFKVVLNDSSMKGKDFRPDNVGISEEVALKINDCEKVCNDGDFIVQPGRSRCSFDNSMVRKCKQLDSYNCAKWDEDQLCDSGNCTGNDQSYKCVTCTDDTRCLPEWSTKCEVGFIYYCKKDTNGCLYWGGKTQCNSGCSDGISCSCNQNVDSCNNIGTTECNNKMIRKCWLDSNGCFVWQGFSKEIECNGNEACTLSPDGSDVNCVCQQGYVGVFPYCFMVSADYCETSQCFPVPPTGQTSCYDYNEKLDSCPLETQDFYGQDAQYPDLDRTYTCYDKKQNKKECNLGSEDGDVVEDSLTKLIWQRYVVSTSEKKKWEDASGQSAPAYCESLNTCGYGGYNNGWRLPNPFELHSIVDNGRSNPSIDPTAFPNTPADYFWSSSSYVLYTTSAWRVGFGYGGVSYSGKPYSYYVRCVRSVASGQGSSDGARFIESEPKTGEKVVTDSVTGLIWQKSYVTDKIWMDALSYCEKLEYGKQTDWRLPNVNELMSLVNYNKSSGATSDFSDMPSYYFWSSSTYVYNTTHAWYVYFDKGDVNVYYKAGTFYVRCVRSGP